tara:strand:+ start:315 stop:1022 length:708 start_codon:yes stop_codon:yes gene_type:complete
MEYSIVIPLLNEEDSLSYLQHEIVEVMNKVSKEFEIVYIDDASTDASLKTLKTLQKQYSPIKIISFKENKGQSAALFAGFKAASGEWIITLDADGQNPPESILDLIKHETNFDFITGVRKYRKDGFIRKIESALARLFRKIILGDMTRDTGCSLRLFRRKIITTIPFFKNFHRFLPFLAKEKGFSIKEVTVKHRERRYGKSKYKGIKRFIAGTFDLFGVLWLKRRQFDYDIKFKN